MKPTTVKNDIETLAQNIARESTHAEVRLLDKVEALKALTAYYGMLNKTKPREDDDESNVSFQKFRERIGA